LFIKIRCNDEEERMVQLIKKGGLRERANRSRSYKGSENTEATLQPNRYAQSKKDEVSSLEQAQSSQELKNDLDVDCESIVPKP
jgi:hypothetical protein